MQTTKRARIRNSFLLISTGLLIAACGSENDGQASLEKAKQYLKQDNQQAAAIIEIKNALQKNPDLGEARFLLGKSYLDQRDAKSAEFELRKAMVLKFDPDQVVPVLANAMLAKAEPDKVLLEFEGYKLQSPEAQAELLSVLGMAYLSTKKNDKAMTAFFDAQKIKPDYPAAVLGEARVLAVEKNFQGAEEKVDGVLARTPKLLDALMLKGDLSSAQKQFEEAAGFYQLAAQEQPNSFTAHFNLASTWLTLNQREKFGEEVDKLKKIAPKHAGVNYFVALRAFNAKEYVKAKEAILQSLVADPNGAQSLLLAGTIEMILNEPAQSEQHFKMVLDKAPGHLFARKQLAALYLKQKQADKAEAVLRPVMGNASQDAELLNIAGDVAIAKGDFARATDLYTQATRINPKNAHALTQNALLQFAKGDDTHAIANLESASLADPGNARADFTLVLTYLQRKQYDKALEAWPILEKRQPNNPLTYNLHAAILFGKKDLAGARKSLERALSIDPTYFPAVANLVAFDLQEKKVDVAKQRFRAVLEKDKNHLPTLLALAELEQNTGASKNTVQALLTQAVQGNPDQTQAVLALANFQAGTGDVKGALNTTKNALVTKPDDIQLLDNAGMLHLRAGETEQALDIYKRLADGNPKQPAFLMRLGSAQAAAGKSEAAHKSFAKALQLQPDSLELQQSAVGFFLQAGKPDDAQIVVDEIRKRSPKSAILTELEGNVLLAKRDYAGAANAYRKVLANSPNLGTLTKLHQTLIKAGDRNEADKLLSNWVKSHPNDEAAQIYSANFTLAEKDYQRAIAQYQAILSKQPNNFLALNNLAWASFQVKDPKALDYAEKAYSLAPANPNVCDTLGWILVEKGQVKRGIELLQKAFGQVPQQLDFRLHLAKALLKDGRKDEARQHLQTIVKSAAGSEIGKESAQLLTKL